MTASTIGYNRKLKTTRIILKSQVIKGLSRLTGIYRKVKISRTVFLGLGRSKADHSKVKKHFFHRSKEAN